MGRSRNASADPEMGPAEANAFHSLSHQKSPSRKLAENVRMKMKVNKFKKMLQTVHEILISKISWCFDWTRAATQQNLLLLLCVIAAILDPLFFYIPMINEGSKCLKSDRKLGVIAIALRSLVDVLHFLLWSFYYEKKWNERDLKIRAGAATSGEEKKEISATSSAEEKKDITSGNSNVFSPGNSRATGRLIEILSILPFPQATTIAIIIIRGSPRSQQVVITMLKFSVLSQFVLRAFRVFPAYNEARKNSLSPLKSRFWIGSGFSLLLLVIASHILGAFWYLLSVGRTMDCWKSACRSRIGCNVDSLYCGGPMDDKSYLDNYCAIEQATNSSAFNFGIYLSALESNIVASSRFSLRLSYCFRWGLINLSSLGQNLSTSAHEWEICFSVCISILGWILFSFFAANMQEYFQLRKNDELEDMELKMAKIMQKHSDLFNWEPFQWLPRTLKEEIISCVVDKWLEEREVDIQTTIQYLPKDLRNKIKLVLCSELQFKVKLLRALTSRAVQQMPNRVKPVVFPEGSLVLRKKDKVDQMVFILNGKLEIIGGTDGHVARELRTWDFFGEQLLREIIDSLTKPQSSIIPPPSAADIKACTKVEAFILNANDLQSLIDLSKDTIEDIKQCLDEPKTPRAPAMQKRKKKPEELIRLRKGFSFKESRTVSGSP